MEAEPASGQSVQRYYDPMIPRFLSVDPVTAYKDPIGAFHRYRYVNNNPYRFVDPDGRQLRGTDNYCSNGAYQCGNGGGDDQRMKEQVMARKTAAERMIDRMSPSVEGMVSDTPEEAAEKFIAIFLPASVYLKLEFGANIVPADTSVVGWSISNIVTSKRFSPETGIGYDASVRSIRGGYDVHTHAVDRNTSDWFNPFSPSDAALVLKFDLHSFLGMPNGSIYILQPGTYPEKMK